MGKKANPKVIGIFVIGAIVLAVAGLLVFGGGKFLTKTEKYVMYFKGSVKGLNVGAPVLFRGVKIGQVSDIQAQFSRVDLNIRIPVVIEVEPSRFVSIGGTLKKYTKEEREFLIKTLIARGLRAQLEMQSFVTGQLAVGLAFHPGTSQRLVGKHKDIIEFPTIESGIEKLTKKIQDLPIDKLISVVINGIQSIEGTLIEVKKLVRTVESQVDPVASSVKKTFKEAEFTLKDARKLIGNVDSKVGPLAITAIDSIMQAKKSIESVELTLKNTMRNVQNLTKNIDRQVEPLASSVADAFDELRLNIKPLSTSVENTFVQARATLKQAQKTLSAAQNQIAPNSPVRYKLEAALEDISGAARSIKVLTDLLEKQPSAILAGKSGPEGKLFVLTSLQKVESNEQPVPIKGKIGIGPIELPGHLNRPQIVTGTSQNEVLLNKNDQWATNLRDNFSNVLAENISVLLPSDQVLIYPWDETVVTRYQVKVRVKRFEGDKGEKSILEAEWTLSGPGGNNIFIKKISTFQEPPSNPNFGATVSAMSENIIKLSREISSALRKIAKK